MKSSRRESTRPCAGGEEREDIDGIFARARSKKEADSRKEMSSTDNLD